MGAMGLEDTGEQQNKVSKDINGLGGYVFGACMAGKFPDKTHICVPRHKRVMRDSGGWG